ncbi:MAG: Ig-like domain-containing protein [Thermoguttaceae bacterium]
MTGFVKLLGKRSSFVRRERVGRMGRTGRGPARFRLGRLEPLEERALLSIYYVNDMDTTFDQWCRAPGDDAHSGLSPAAPKASLQAVLDSYEIQPGDIIRIDTGRYWLAGNIEIGPADGGTSAAWVSFQFSPYGVTFDRGDTSPGSYGIHVNGASYVRFQTVTSTKHPAAQRWMSVTGAYEGIRVAGDHVSFSRIESVGNLHSAVSVIGPPAAHVTLENILAWGTSDPAAGAGIRIEGADFVTVRNATIADNGRYALYVADANDAALASSILWADGPGACAMHLAGLVTGTSDYNDLWATGGAQVAYTPDSGDLATLADWQSATGQDAHSLSANPWFANLAGGNLHLRSNGRMGGTGGGRYDPQTNLPPQDPLAWVVDLATSPCIDAGDPTSGYVAEPDPDGSRVNLGAYGNTEQASVSDTIAPALVAYTLTEDSGQSATDLLTNDTTPTLIFVFSEVITGSDGDVRVVDPSGDPVAPLGIAGWQTDRIVVTFPVPLSESGQYTVTLNGTTSIRDLGGNPLSGGDQVRLFQLDIQPPAVEEYVLVEDTGTSDDDQITSDTTPTLSIRFGEPVFGDAAAVCVTDPGGHPVTPDAITGWGTDVLVIAFSTPLSEQGQYTVALDGTSIEDAAGNLLDGGAEVQLYFTIDTQGPSLTSYWLADDNGPGSDDQITNDATPTLTFEFDEPVFGSDADVVVTDPSGDPVTPDAISGWASGTLVVEFAVPLSEQGQYTVTLKGTPTITDAAGNPLGGGTDLVRWFRLDTDAPAVQSYALVEDTGVSGTDLITSDTTPVFTVALSEAIYGTDADLALLDPAGNPVTPDSIVGWGTDTLVVTLSTPLGQQGEYSVILKGTATITDVAGNPLGGGVDALGHFTLDTSGPVVTAYWLTDDNGPSQTDQITNDPTPVLSFVFDEAVYGTAADVLVSDPAGNPVTPDSVSGWGTDTLVVALSTPLGEEGDYTVILKGTATITDAAGNPLGGGDEEFYFVLDFQAPELTAYWLVTDTGLASDDQVTSDQTPELHFLFDVPVYGAVTDLTVIAPSGNPVSPQQISGWGTTELAVTFTTALAEQGEYTVTLNGSGTVEDIAGNPLGGGVDELRHFTLDSAPPTADILDVVPDPRTTPVDEIQIVFSEPVYGLELAELRLTRDGGADLLTGSEPLSTADNIHWVLGGLGGLTAPAGDYRLELAASGSGIQDQAGNALAHDAQEQWTVNPTVFVGSPGDDAFMFETDGAWHTVTVTLAGGPTQTYFYLASVPVSLSFDGQEGEDWLGICGGPATETAILRKHSVEFLAADYQVYGLRVETIAVAAAGGASQIARLYDSSANDVLTVEPLAASMIGPGYANSVSGFDKVFAFANAGGPADEAHFYDSPLNDAFSAKITHAYMTGPGYYSFASGFEQVFGYATAGGTSDQAHLYDSAGDDTFTFTAAGIPTGLMSNHSGSARHAAGFERTFAYSRAGGADSALLYDSPASDTFVGRPASGFLTGPGFYASVSGFPTLSAYATSGGSADLAMLYDSPGDDTLEALPAYGQLLGPGFCLHAEGFDQLLAFATSGDDQAHFYGSAASDTFYGRPAYSSMTGADYSNYAAAFDAVFAHLTAEGDEDQAWLFDSPGDDHFWGHLADAVLTDGLLHPLDGTLLSSGTYYLRVFGADRVTADGSQGPVNQRTIVPPIIYDLIFSGVWS